MEKQKLIAFFKKFGYYIVAGILLIAIGVTLMIATSNLETAPKDDNIIDVGSQPITFGLPMIDFTVLSEYNDQIPLYNKTLNVFEAHKFYKLTSENLDVYAVANGTVTKTGFDNDFGYYVVITHLDGFKSYYASLDQNLNVKTGDTVQKGQLLGKASDSAMVEVLDGAHLHFELFKDDKKVNPSNYLNFEGK